tara:strand:+ start:2556 stop:2816 length:261 start_codon:yes stop_codon:yes gene_type:complete
MPENKKTVTKKETPKKETPVKASPKKEAPKKAPAPKAEAKAAPKPKLTTAGELHKAFSAEAGGKDAVTKAKLKVQLKKDLASLKAK